jgi:hypothetical protein
MNKKSEIDESKGSLDTVKLFVAVAVLLGSIVAYYALPHLHAVVRILMVLVGVGVAGFIVYKTALGESWFRYIIHTKKRSAPSCLADTKRNGSNNIDCCGGGCYCWDFSLVN